MLFTYEIKRGSIDYRVVAGDVSMIVDIALPVLQRILMHLVANAIEYVHDQDEKSITVDVRAVEKIVSITIWNSGPPIPDDVSAHMFTPYFTTKGDAHAGMGLFTARASTQTSGGDLSYTPEAGFCLTLPKAFQ